jgi:hypothetical protein
MPRAGDALQTRERFFDGGNPNPPRAIELDASAKLNSFLYCICLLHAPLSARITTCVV